MDVTDHKAVQSLLAEIKTQYGTLQGVIHSAGIIRDHYILKKTAEEFKTVLSAKVRGTYYLDEATGDLPLDFFILFSSLAGVMGNSGQVDYATANAFIKAYAEYRKTLVKKNKRHGQTLAIHWPLSSRGHAGR